MTCPEKLILTLQIFAACLMGADYFVGEKVRLQISQNLLPRVKALHKKLSEEMSDGATFVAGDDGIFGKSYLFAALRFIIAGAIIYVIVEALDLPKSSLSQLEKGKWKFWEALYIIPIGYGLLRFSIVLFALGLLLVMSLPYWLVTKFLLYSPKGIVFAIGFVFLIASFVCRYVNVPAG